MRLLIAVVLCLSLITVFISEDSIKNIFEHFGAFILRFFLCFFVLLIINFLFLVFMSGTGSSVSEFIDGHGVIATDDLCKIAVWFVFQTVICSAEVVCLRIIECHWKRQSVPLFRKKQEHGFCGLVFASLLFFAVSVGLKSWSESQLIINEVCSTGIVSLDDYAAEDVQEYSGDYIELYNPSLFNISLSCFYVSDDLDKQPKQTAADGVIPAGGYAIVRTEEGDYNFSVSNDGNEVIYLFNSNGTVIDSVKIPKLKKGTVYARNTSEEGWGIYTPSPMAENSGNEIKSVSAPVFSAESGFYDKAFTLQLSAAEGCKIYYTLDGSTPDENAILYEDGIEIRNVSDEPNVYKAVQNVEKDWKTYTPSENPVDKATVIRAAAFDEENNRSEIITKTYFIDLVKYQDQFVLSLVSEPEELFGENGIYVTGKAYDEWYLGDQEGDEPDANFSNRGIDYEIETNVEMFCDSNLLLAQTAGLRIQGDSSRERLTKGFKLYSRKRYSGSYYFDYEFFDQATHSFALRLGNDSDGFPDAFVESLIPDRDIGGKQSIPVSVFLNGEYWFDYYLTEIYSEDYIAQKFNLNRSEITVISYIPGEITAFLEEHDLSQEEDYLLFCELVDVQNYIDFMVDNIYLCNMDWSEMKNVKMWKSEGNSGIQYDDGKWRFLVHDMDAISWNNKEGYYGADSYAINSFSTVQRYTGVAYDQGTIFSALLQNEDFCRQFVLTFMDFANTYFEKGRVEQQLLKWGEDITWCDSFFEKRFDYIVPDLAEEFHLTGTLEQITLKTNLEKAGTIMINTVAPELSGGEWSGYYYTDYPVTLSVTPAEGYDFIGWRHGDTLYTDLVVEPELTGGDNVWEAEFVKVK